MGNQITSDVAQQILTATITDLVVELVEAKCQKLSPRERGTLGRRIGKAIDVFVRGLKPPSRRPRAQGGAK